MSKKILKSHTKLCTHFWMYYKYTSTCILDSLAIIHLEGGKRVLKSASCYHPLGGLTVQDLRRGSLLWKEPGLWDQATMQLCISHLHFMAVMLGSPDLCNWNTFHGVVMTIRCSKNIGSFPFLLPYGFKDNTLHFFEIWDRTTCRQNGRGSHGLLVCF